MKRALVVQIRRGAALACCLAAFVFQTPEPAVAGLAGSLHDFRTGPVPNTNATITGSGPCSACHIPHKADGSNFIWARPLDNEISFYMQAGAPDYVTGSARWCYDCHDDAFSADADPAPIHWNSSHMPQDIALDSTKVGYYELGDGSLPPGGVGGGPVDGSATGGHYWKSVPGATYARGDKIPCGLCHDPHDSLTGTGSGKNEAFFRLLITDGTNNYDNSPAGGLNASSNMRNGTGTGTGREMCIFCHGTSDVATLGVTLWGVIVSDATRKLPSTVAPHVSTDTTPCTNCHSHNRIVASCKDCHGYPPLDEAVGGNYFHPTDRPNTESYSGGAGAHRRHRNALGAAIFDCSICHGPNPGSATWHRNNTVSVIQANVDIIGKRSMWDPGDTRATAYTGAASSETLPTTPTDETNNYEFLKKGGGTQQCSGLACHGGPPAADPANALNWTDKMVDDTTGAAESIEICKWCHDSTPAQIGAAGAVAPNVLGNNDGGASATGNWSTGTWGADVNGHGNATSNFYDTVAVGTPGTTRPGAGRQCAACHDARYQGDGTPYKTHFNGTVNRLWDTINTITLASPVEDAACAACHQNGATGAAEGTEISTHGNSSLGGYVAIETDNQYTRSCRQCHNVHGANWNGLSGAAPGNGRNLYMIGSWVDDGDGVAEAGEEARVDSDATTNTTTITTADKKVIFTTTSGEDSYDDGASPTNDGLADSVCVVCHLDLMNNHNEVTDVTTLRGAGHNPVGTDCIGCHDHDYDNNVATTDGFAPSGCNGCHGTNDTETPPGTQNVDWFRGQFWPDGSAALSQYTYADNQPAAHLNHVKAIAGQVFGETPAQLVADAASATKQKVVCEFCHPNPGEPGHYTDSAADPSGTGRVEVFQGGSAGNYFRKFTTGTHPTYGGTNFADDTTGGAYGGGTGYPTESCASLVCHNQAATPASPTGWNAPPSDWTASANSDCSNTTCHAPGIPPTGTYTSAHDKHVGNGNKNYACSECHTNNFSPVVNPGHGNGGVDMNGTAGAWNSAGTLEGTKGGGDGFYDKEAGGAASAGDTGFAYKSGSYATCSLIYCHGGDNTAWGGGNTTPVWDPTVTGSSYCGSCHDANSSDAVNPGGTDVIADGNHTAHINASYGPRFADPTGPAGPGATVAASCLGTATVGCHSDFTLATASHVNGTVEFANIDTSTVPVSALGLSAPAGAPDGTSTDRCNSCHSTAVVTVHANGTTVTGAGTVLAKTNWASSTYTLPCLSCHNGADPATVHPNGTTAGVVDAPDMLGTDAANGSGAEIRGHNRAAADGAYPVSGNPAAAKACTDCHDAAAIHINGSNETTYAGNRMLADIGGIAGVTTPTDACKACHANAASAATRKNINTHSNSSYTGRLEAVFSGPECMQCHDPHGMTANGTGYNIYMVPSTVHINGTTTATGVRFEAVTGNYSFNDKQDPYTPADDLCVVCHASGANPGQPMAYNVDGQHSSTPGYDNDERGRDCTGCHTHNRDSAIATADGFMPLACNECHTYPGLTDLDNPTPRTPPGHRNSAAHDIHAGEPVAGPVNNYAFPCRTCHFGNDHNQSGMTAGVAWSVPDNAYVNIRFDPARNGGSPTYAGANASTQPAPGVGGTGTCALLYCHGDGAPFPAADTGTLTQPAWNVSTNGDCGTCHGYTAGAAPGANAHPKHVGPAAGGQYAIGCKVCHYGTTTDDATIAGATGMALHVNGSADVSFNGAADARVHVNGSYAGDAAVGSGYGACSAIYCHSNGADQTAPFDDTPLAVPAVAIPWNSTTATCATCHGDGAASSTPAYVDGAPKANKHDKHVAKNGYGCQICHWPTTHGNGTAIFAAANHVNGSYDVDDDGAAPALDQFNYATGSCSLAECHGGNTVSWSLTTTITCDICHAQNSASAVGVTDVNNFAWDGSIQSKINDVPATGEFAVRGHGAKSLACAGCHDSAAEHDPTLAGANPYRLGAGFTCSNTTSCHTGALTSVVRTHTPAEMLAGGGHTVKRTWPAWDPQCVNCHDPHGDGANIAMIQRELYDKAAFPLTGAAPAAPTEQTGLVFTDNAAGIGAGTFAQDTPDFSGVCQECHELAVASGGVVSFHDGPTGGTVSGTNHPSTGGNPGDCSSCHTHTTGFAPRKCEGCHNSVTPFVQGTATAPNVMGPNGTFAGTGGKPYDDASYGFNVNGHGRDASTFAISKGNPIDKACTACHDIGQPAGEHLNGTLNGRLSPDTRNANSFHLSSSFISASAPGSEWDVQVTFDAGCSGPATGCHTAGNQMRHALDADPAANAMQFGQHSTYAAPLNTPPPIMFYDKHLRVLTPYDNAPHFALCVTCHNPHGTNAPSSRTDGNNKMMLYRWSNPDLLCAKCH